MLLQIVSSWQTKIQDGCHYPIYCQFKVQRHSHQFIIHENYCHCLLFATMLPWDLYSLHQPCICRNLYKLELIWYNCRVLICSHSRFTCSHILVRTSYGATDCSSMRCTCWSIKYFFIHPFFSGSRDGGVGYTSSHPKSCLVLSTQHDHNGA